MKTYLLKIFYGLVLAGDSDSSIWDRITNVSKFLMTFSPILFIFSALEKWYLTYEGFIIAMIIIVSINATLGGVMRAVYGGFSWGTLLLKTMLMIIIIGTTYLVLELIISRASDGTVVNSFRTVLQIATLLYPGTKIIKNIYLLSDGEHPPEWVMKRLYNFNKNGNLKDLIDSKNKKEEQNETNEEL
jgi:hypothetical protein